jgi:hypothetical protein
MLRTSSSVCWPRAEGYPLLGPGMESSVPGLHFLGAPAAWSFGPIVRFVSGGWYTGRAPVRTIVGSSRLPAAAEPAPVPTRAGAVSDVVSATAGSGRGRVAEACA